MNMAPADSVISLAVPRGRLFEQLLPILRTTGVPAELEDQDARRLTVERGNWRLLFARPHDISLFVERGVADYGFAGKDLLLEEPRQVVEALDLGVGACRLVLAVPGPLNGNGLPPVRRVATKYPRLASRLLAEAGFTVEVLTMHGSVESAPALGLADGIVDLVQTGATLKANGLVEALTLLSSTARLIANPVAYRLRGERARDWIGQLRQAVGR
jgi:ATP phosphoribosyltransferase